MTNEKAIEVLMWALNRLDGHNYIVDGYGTVDIRAKVDAFGMAIESLRHGSRHGRWIVRGIDIDELAYGGRCYTPKYQCMVCGNIYESYRRYDEPVMPEDADYPNYCDNCGATMDGE